MQSYLSIHRGKAKDGHWAIGYYCFDPDTKEHIIHTSFSQGLIESCVVDPDTIGICSSIFDPNGHVIFEGDYIGHSLNIAEFTCGSFCTNGDRDLYLQSRTLNVIGNTYDGVLNDSVPYLWDMLTRNQKVDLHIITFNLEGKEFESNVKLSDREILDRLTGQSSN